MSFVNPTDTQSPFRRVLVVRVPDVREQRKLEIRYPKQHREKPRILMDFSEVRSDQIHTPAKKIQLLTEDVMQPRGAAEVSTSR